MFMCITIVVNHALVPVCFFHYEIKDVVVHDVPKEIYRVTVWWHLQGGATVLSKGEGWLWPVTSRVYLLPNWRGGVAGSIWSTTSPTCSGHW